MPSDSVVRSKGARTFALVVLTLIIGCCVTTDLIWVQHGGHGLPSSISDTWTDPPGTYISRWCIGNAALMWAILNTVIYVGENGVRGTKPINPKFILGVCYLSMFCLSWVAAICDDNKPSCKGNGTLHGFFATSTFVLFDLAMLMTAYNRKARSDKGSSMALFLAVASSILSFVHLRLPHYSGQFGSFPITDIVEWTNIIIGCVCLLHIVFYTPNIENLSVGVVDTKWAANRQVLLGGHGVTPDVSISAWQAAKLIFAVYIGLLVLSAVVGLKKGYLPVHKGELWYISDMWTEIPGNWLSRWGVIQGAHFGMWAQYALYCTKDPGSGANRSYSQSKIIRLILLVVAETAIFGLSIVGVCNEYENLNIHLTGATMYFGGYDLYILITLGARAMDYISNKAKFVNWGMILFGFVKVFAHLARKYIDSGNDPIFQDVSAALEWADALAIIGFLMADVMDHENCDDVLMAIFSRKRRAETNVNGSTLGDGNYSIVV